MIRSVIAALAACVVAAPAGASSEGAAASARAAFGASLSAPQPRFERAAMVLASADSSGEGVRPKGQTTPLTPVATVNLGEVLNAQQKGGLRYELGGKSVWIGTVFDSAHSAYLSILVDGSAPRFVGVLGIVVTPFDLDAGTGHYSVYLQPNLSDFQKSEVIIENKERDTDKTRITLKAMMAASAGAGRAVRVGGGDYRVYYTDDIAGGRANPATKVFTFLFIEKKPDGKEDIYVYVITSAQVPADRIAVFKLFADKKVGLMQTNGTLQVYDLP